MRQETKMVPRYKVVRLVRKLKTKIKNNTKAIHTAYDRWDTDRFDELTYTNRVLQNITETIEADLLE